MEEADNTTNQTPFINSQIDSFQLIDLFFAVLFGLSWTVVFIKEKL